MYRNLLVLGICCVFSALLNHTLYAQTTTPPVITNPLIQVELIKPEPNQTTQTEAQMNEGTNDPTSTGAKMILSGEKAYYVKEYENMIIVQEEIEN